MRARPSMFVFLGILCCFISAVIGTYEPAGYGTHYAYAPAPVHHHQGHGGGHNAGSYYHYHVPLVGQQQHYHPQHQQSDHHHLLYLLLPLLLLLALPLLFLPLLPLLLLPIGLSLLALLAPLLMMGGMMMMMMMMGGGMMMPMMRRGIDGQNDMRTLGELLFGDMASLATKYARSLDLDHCPERVACEIGSAVFPPNASRTTTARAFMNYVVDNAIPKGKARKLIRQYREALWTGSKTNTCVVYHCQPSLRMNFDDDTTPKSKQASGLKAGLNFNAASSGVKINETTPVDSPQSNYYTDYYNQYQQYLNSNYNATEQDKLSAAEAYYKYYAQNQNQNPVENEISGSDASNAGGFYSAFGTPVVRS